jgi:hypothetical protein
MGRIGIILTVGAATCLMARSARAQTYCGSSPGDQAWNAPNGAIVFSVGDSNDIIGNVLHNLGELRSHTMMSHGASGWALHNTMKMPSMSDLDANVFNFCGAPIDGSKLQYGYPGARDITQGAMWQFLFNQGSTPLAVWYQETFAPGTQYVTTAGANVLDWEWNSAPYRSVSDGNNVMFQLLNDSGTDLVYSLPQFMNAGMIPWGNSAIPSGDPNGGTVCSTLAAYIEAKAGYAPTTPYWYTNRAQIQNAAIALVYGIADMVAQNGIANVAFDCVANSCGINFCAATALPAILPLLPAVPPEVIATLSAATCCNFDNGNALRVNIGSQVANCMAANQCGYGNGSLWQWFANYTYPSSITPDRMGGWGVHSGASIWAYSGSYAVQWNAPGSVYGCWD